MERRMALVLISFTVVILSALSCYAEDPSFYVKKDTWQDTVLESRQAQMTDERS
ncbi:MAG: hypothetical protein ACYS0I_10500 [Planctomycetota bacterium]|jgi:hypothetical protein